MRSLEWCCSAASCLGVGAAAAVQPFAGVWVEVLAFRLRTQCTALRISRFLHHHLLLRQCALPPRQTPGCYSPRPRRSHASHSKASLSPSTILSKRAFNQRTLVCDTAQHVTLLDDPCPCGCRGGNRRLPRPHRFLPRCLEGSGVLCTPSAVGSIERRDRPH